MANTTRVFAMIHTRGMTKTNAPNQRYECHLGIPRMAFAMIHTVDFLISSEPRQCPGNCGFHYNTLL